MRGGRRANAGRKVDQFGHRLSISVRLTESVLAYLKTRDESAGKVIDDCVRNSGEFRRWLVQRGGR